MKVGGSRRRRGVVAVAMLASLGFGQARGRSSIVTELGATGVDADARGGTRLVLRTASKGRFDVTVKRLPGDAVFEVLVNGVNRTSEECAAQGGVNMGPGTCDPNPCG